MYSKVNFEKYKAETSRHGLERACERGHMKSPEAGLKFVKKAKAGGVDVRELPLYQRKYFMKHYRCELMNMNWRLIAFECYLLIVDAHNGALITIYPVDILCEHTHFDAKNAKVKNLRKYNRMYGYTEEYDFAS